MLHRFRTKVIFKVKLGSGFPELLRVLMSVLSVFSFISLPKVLFYSAYSFCFHMSLFALLLKQRKKPKQNKNKAPASANKLL